MFPAATTQFKSDLSIDIAETQRVQDALVRDGVHGLIIMGTVGENNSLEPERETRSVLRAAVEAVDKRVPVLAGVSEFDTKRAIAFARDAEKIGADGLMLLPAMVYVPTEAELVAHFSAVAEATALADHALQQPASLSRERRHRGDASSSPIVPNIVCLKESAPDTRRFTDLYNAVGDKIHAVRRPR